MAKELPALQGHRYKTRKRDEKVKYDPKAFSDGIIARINEADGDLESIGRILDKTGETQDYRAYAEALFEVIIAGGILAPGGKVESEPPATTCVFSAEPTVDSIRSHVQILTSLIRRYRYLQKKLSEEMNKVLNYLKSFTETQRMCLAIFTALCMMEGLVLTQVLKTLFSEHLVKDESIALAFITVVFRTWVDEKGHNNLGTALRKAFMENKLLNFLPPHKRKEEFFDEHFEGAGLHELVAFRKSHQNARIKKNLKEKIDELLTNDAPHSEIIENCQEFIDNDELTEVDVTVLIWKSIMDAVEWNKKEDLLTDQALRHLHTHAKLFTPFCEQGTPQLTLLLRIQEYCYSNVNFRNIFYRMVYLLYDNDVLTEQAILKWYNDSHLPKGKTVFLPQMKKMVDWLNTAEEESEEESTVATTS